MDTLFELFWFCPPPPTCCPLDYPYLHVEKTISQTRTPFFIYYLHHVLYYSKSVNMSLSRCVDIKVSKISIFNKYQKKVHFLILMRYDMTISTVKPTRIRSIDSMYNVLYIHVFFMVFLTFLNHLEIKKEWQVMPHPVVSILKYEIKVFPPCASISTPIHYSCIPLPDPSQYPTPHSPPQAATYHHIEIIDHSDDMTEI